MKFYSIGLLAAFSLFHVDAFAQSDSSNFKSERFSLTIGGFYTGMSSSVTVGIDDLGLGVNLQMEDALGLETTTTVFRSEGVYTFGKRRNKQISLGYFGLIRRANKKLGRDLTIGERVFKASTVISTRFNLEVIKFSYNYGFFKDERMRLGVGAGLFVMPIGFSIGNENTESEFLEFIAPLPAFGLSTEFYISPQWTFSQSLDLLYVKYLTFSGKMTDLNIKLEYSPNQKFAFGTGINSYNLDLKMTGDFFLDLDFVGQLNTSYTGVLFYAKYRLNYK